MAAKPRKKTPTGSDEVPLARADELPERWSVQRNKGAHGRRPAAREREKRGPGRGGQGA